MAVALQGKDEFGNNRSRWYNGYLFPLIPIISTRKKDYHNTSSYSFHWLFLKVWSLDSFAFELSFHIDTHWGIGVAAILPYTRIVLAIPCPTRVGFWVYENLNRKADTQK